MKWTLIATWKMAAEGMRMAEANLQKSGSADQALETVITAVEGIRGFIPLVIQDCRIRWASYNWTVVI